MSFLVRPNGPELSCGDVQPIPCRIYARQMSPFLKKFFARGEIVDGWFRQLERLVRQPSNYNLILAYPFR